jgi:uridine kinase
VEGIYSIRKELEEFFDQKIWVECSAETRLNRGVKRDGESMRKYLGRRLDAQGRESI